MKSVMTFVVHGNLEWTFDKCRITEYVKSLSAN